MAPLNKTTAAGMRINPGKLKEELEAVYTFLEEQKAPQRLFASDASLWKTDSEQVKSINNRLGWLKVPDTMLQEADELAAFANQIKGEGYKYVMLLGMGGSSLCSEVAREMYCTAQIIQDSP